MPFPVQAVLPAPVNAARKRIRARRYNPSNMRT
jgi:hypothetical protein